MEYAMSATLDPALPATEQQLIDQVRSTVDQLSPAGYRRLLAVLAQKRLAAEGGSVVLEDDDGKAIACLYSTERPVFDFASEFTEEELAAIERNLTDPKQLMTLEELLARLHAEHGHTGSPG